MTLLVFLSSLPTHKTVQSCTDLTVLTPLLDKNFVNGFEPPTVLELAKTIRVPASVNDKLCGPSLAVDLVLLIELFGSIELEGDAEKVFRRETGV